MVDRLVAVGDDLTLPAAVLVPSARLSDSTVAGRALVTATDVAAQLDHLGLGASDPVHVEALPGLLDNRNSYNGSPFTQDNVTSHNGVQYAVWADDERHPIIGRRTLPTGPWSTFDLADVAGNPLASPTVQDGHNNYVVAVDTDGYIHVSGNHHADPLRYVRSSAPGDITAWTAPGMVGAQETQVTYPQFFRLPDGTLLFLYRDGVSGAGDTYLNVYSTGTQTWTRRAHVFDGTDADPESAYNNHVAISAAGVIHLFYVWRLTSSVTDTWNVCHVKSANGGVAWTNAAGGALTLPITYDTSPVVRAGDLELINQTGADVDTDGRPHAVWWLSDPTTRLVHYWHDGSAWHEDVELDLGYYDPPINLARPAVVCHGGRTFALYSLETAAARRRTWIMRDITPTPAVRLPIFPLYHADLGAWEPSFDTRAARERDELAMLITPLAPGGTGTGSSGVAEYAATWGAVLTADLTRIAQTAHERTVQPPPAPETHFIRARDFVSTFNSPTLDGGAHGAPAYLLDAALLEVVAATASVPPWRAFNIDLWWSNAGAGSGDVAVQARYSQRGDGNNITASETTLSYVTLTAPAQNVIKVTSVATGVVRIPSTILRISLRRNGADAADTLGNDMSFLGFMLTRVA